MKTETLIWLAVVGFGVWWVVKNKQGTLQWEVNPQTGKLEPANVPVPYLPALPSTLVSPDITGASGGVQVPYANAAVVGVSPFLQTVATAPGGASGSW
jgi:hypothetical protein